MSEVVTLSFLVENFNQAFEEKLSAIKNAIKKNVFLLESFNDYIDDLENADWEYFEKDENAWREELFVLPNATILDNLEKYRSDCEKVAYQEGYLPDNEGTDVREWAHNLSSYF